MTPDDLQNLIAKLESKLARQKNAMKLTVDELKTVEDINTRQHSPALELTIRNLGVKWLRQQNAINATEGYLKVLTSTTGVKTATK